MKKINVLIIGSGGREHAMAWKIAKSNMVDNIFCAPGNPGIGKIAKCIDIKSEDIDSLLKFAIKNNIGLTVVGPEDPLTLGIVDKFEAEKLVIFGPNKKAAILEGSKVFSKNLMRKHRIPTADFKIFEDSDLALGYLETITLPIVIKASGLAKGKGVFVCQTESEAKDAINQIMGDKIFGFAGNEVVIEEFIEGREISIFAFTDGQTISMLEMAQDHKAAYDGGKGPNTGGMGAFSPAPPITESIYNQIAKLVIVPAVHAMNHEERPYKGLLYAGLIVKDSKVKVLEFNVRFGDPETQPLLMRMKSDLVPILLATINGSLDQIEIEWDQRPAVCVVVASGGYPGKYETGYEIKGLDNIENSDDVAVFHAGTKLDGDKVLTNGGRVLNVTTMGDDIESAQKKAYEIIEKISFNDAFCRKDIASKAIQT